MRNVGQLHLAAKAANCYAASRSAMAGRFVALRMADAVQVLVVRADWSDVPSADSSWLPDASILTWIGGSSDPMNQLKAFYTKSSYGRLTITSVTTAPGVVRFPGARNTYSASSNVVTLYTQLQPVMAAIGPTYDPANYDLLIVVWAAKDVRWSWAGMATTSSPTAKRPMLFMLNGGAERGPLCTSCFFGLLCHELSHALGNGPHTAAWYGTPGNVPLSSKDAVTQCAEGCDPCNECSIDQMDIFDPLGWPGITSHAQNNAINKWGWGFIVPSEVFFTATFGAGSAGFGTTVRLHAHDIGSSAVPSAGSANKLALAASSSKNNETWFWAEYKVADPNVYKTSLFSDPEIQALRTRGVILHMGAGPTSGSMWAPQLIDTTPTVYALTSAKDNTLEGLIDAPLQAGRTAAFVAHDVYITVMKVDCAAVPPYAEVVARRKPAGDTPPTIASVASTQAVCAGVAATVVCDAADAQTPVTDLAYEWDMGEGHGAWDSESVRQRSYTWVKPGSYTISCTVSDGTGYTVTKSAVITVGGQPVDEVQAVNWDGANELVYDGGTITPTGGFLKDGSSASSFPARTSPAGQFYVDFSSMWLNGPTSKLGWFGSTQWMGGFKSASVIFKNIVIPQGTVVETAYLQFTSSGEAANGIGSVRIRLENQTAAAWVDALGAEERGHFKCSSCLSGRSFVSPTVDWAIPDWPAAAGAGTVTTTPDLKSLISSLVARSDWSGSGPMHFSLTPLSGTGTAGVKSVGTKLVVKWRRITGGVSSCPAQSLDVPEWRLGCSPSVAAATSQPTSAPTSKPAPGASNAPTQPPSGAPTQLPTATPTKQPTQLPTLNPTIAPTYAPTAAPTIMPTGASAFNSLQPSLQHTGAPTQSPTISPTQPPSLTPSLMPTVPSSWSSVAPTTARPTAERTYVPVTQ